MVWNIIKLKGYCLNISSWKEAQDPKGVLMCHRKKLNGELFKTPQASEHILMDEAFPTRGWLPQGSIQGQTRRSHWAGQQLAAWAASHPVNYVPDSLSTLGSEATPASVSAEASRLRNKQK